jgi:hypothetical protein
MKLTIAISAAQALPIKPGVLFTYKGKELQVVHVFPSKRRNSKLEIVAMSPKDIAAGKGSHFLTVRFTGKASFREAVTGEASTRSARKGVNLHTVFHARSEGLNSDEVAKANWVKFDLANSIGKRAKIKHSNTTAWNKIVSIKPAEYSVIVQNGFKQKEVQAQLILEVKADKTPRHSLPIA